MKIERNEQIERFLDGSLSVAEMEQFSRDVRADAELRATLVAALRLIGLTHAARDAEAWTAKLIRVTSLLIASDDTQHGFESRVMARCGNNGMAHGVCRRAAKRTIPFLALLTAAAACLVIVAGVWWFNQSQGGPLGLRVAEASGEASIIEDGKLKIEDWKAGGGENSQQPKANIQHSTPNTQQPNGKMAVVGMEIRQGDRVVVGKGGKVGLKYDGEATTIELLASTAAAFGAESGAKRVTLAAGRLVCSAAPQKLPFRMDTPHAIAEVVGTRFQFGVNGIETALAVQEGKVVLRQKGKLLEVVAGETGVADADGLRKLSTADSWIRELLVRAESGPWDVVNLGTGVYSKDVWRMEACGEPDERRIWNMPLESDRSGMVSFRDGKRWSRGVVTGRMMILPEGQAALDVQVAAATSPAIGWAVHRFRVENTDGVWQKLRITAVTLSGGRPPETERNCICPILNANEHPAGAWYRFAVYFDMETPRVQRVVYAAWPEGTAMPLPVSKWVLQRFASKGDSDVEIGLMAKGVLMVTQGLKFVPLDPDMPMPPKELTDRK